MTTQYGKSKIGLPPLPSIDRQYHRACVQRYIYREKSISQLNAIALTMREREKEYKYSSWCSLSLHLSLSPLFLSLFLFPSLSLSSVTEIGSVNSIFRHSPFFLLPFPNVEREETAAAAAASQKRWREKMGLCCPNLLIPRSHWLDLFPLVCVKPFTLFDIPSDNRGYDALVMFGFWWKKKKKRKK